MISELVSPPKSTTSVDKKGNHLKELLDEYFVELVARNQKQLTEESSVTIQSDQDKKEKIRPETEAGGINSSTKKLSRFLNSVRSSKKIDDENESIIPESPKGNQQANFIRLSAAQIQKLEFAKRLVEKEQISSTEENQSDEHDSQNIANKSKHKKVNLPFQITVLGGVEYTGCGVGSVEPILQSCFPHRR